MQIFVKEVTQDLWIHPQDTDNILMKVWKESNLKMRIFVCDKFLTAFAAPLKHRTRCFGYVVQEKQIPGKLDPSLLKQKGIPPGSLY